MKQRHHTPEQVIRKLAEGEKLLAQGKGIEEVARHLEITESTWHRWRNQYGGMKADDAKELKELRRENQRLKEIVADQALDIDMLTGTRSMAAGCRTCMMCDQPLLTGSRLDHPKCPGGRRVVARGRSDHRITSFA
jgi:putative transposase